MRRVVGQRIHFHVTPCILGRVELGSIRGKELNRHVVRTGIVDHIRRTVRIEAVPQNDDVPVASEIPAQLREKTPYVDFRNVLVSMQSEQELVGSSAGQARDRANDGDFLRVPATLRQHGSVSSWCPTPSHQRRQ